MMRLKSDLVDLLEAAIEGNLDNHSIRWDERSSLGVVMAAGGYPESYAKGDNITGIPDATESSKVFHAGTAIEDNEIISSGGRVC